MTQYKYWPVIKLLCFFWQNRKVTHRPSEKGKLQMESQCSKGQWQNVHEKGVFLSLLWNLKIAQIPKEGQTWQKRPKNYNRPSRIQPFPNSLKNLNDPLEQNLCYFFFSVGFPFRTYVFCVPEGSNYFIFGKQVKGHCMYTLHWMYTTCGNHPIDISHCSSAHSFWQRRYLWHQECVWWG